MSALEKATLHALKATPPTETEGDPVTIQFNPSSLRIQIANHTSGGQEPTGPRTEHTGGSSTLSLELHFDTADEGTTDAPHDVRSRTLQVASFVLPRTTGTAPQPPPRVRFRWGAVIFDGVMTSFSENLDLFSASGVPLRAQVSVTIQNQDPRYESATGRGAARASGAAAPGAEALALGGVGLGASATLGGSIGIALDGESPPSFAARMGLDPAAWRALASPGGMQLSLQAGAEVAFAHDASTAPGAGSASGSAQPSHNAALERVDGPAPRPRTPGEVAQTGVALVRAGGVDAALQTVRQQRADSASAQELHAFGLRPGAPAAASAASAAPRSPRRALAALPRPGATGAPAPAPPHADERATTFGLGVPLRPRRAVPHANAGVPVALGRRAPAAAAVPAPPPAHAGDCGCGCGGAS